MKIESGYAYHIKDDFFKNVNDHYLMNNKENGHYRPTYYCMRDKNTGLLWMIPMSSKADKYQAIYDKQVARYGKCLTIVIGKYDGKRAAFLLQNMFPITEKYLDHIHTKKGNPVPIHTTIQKIINTNMKQLLHLIKLNKKVVFPDVKNIEKMMLLELYEDAISAKDYVAATTDNKDIEKR
ncbi:type III toxin-antitoxin system CptIN family toxin [Xylanivirga thermophila]|uniref:type III toxin-antitoxin system CptIN family toxin n=1 Tax=Xylanivirga thermophila TaxID=2496273 RepID=UPI00101DA323|nr:hypothetical protein [Xylanivirga thermophila]